MDNNNFKKEKRLSPHRDLNLSDLGGEVWKDVYGYDGIYSVSNYGRIKSEQRYDSMGRVVKEKIRKQCGCRNGVLSVRLSINNIQETRSVMRMVGEAFLGDKDEGFVYCHKNKIQTDNRLSNIIKVTRSESTEIDYRVGVKTDWGISTVIQDSTRDYLDKYGIYENGSLVGKVCINCHKEYPLDNYYEYKGDGTHLRECKVCVLKKRGVKDVGKLTDRIELAEKGLRYCSVCKELKNLDTDFSNSKTGYLGKANNCKKCNYELLSGYQQKQKQIIGDFYVKQYALSRHGLRISDGEVEKYRHEIKEKRKPKYFIDGESFVTMRDFAKYIELKYGNPISTTEKRISNGKTENECKLTESEIRSIAQTKGKIRVIDMINGKIFEFKNTRDDGLNRMFSASAIAKAIKTGEPTKTTKLSKYQNPCTLERI